jgi:putative FmdB family regulatory protein
MPIYEYECTSCKTRFERSQRFSDPPVTECPECGGRVRRVLFPAGIVFKGSGWYVTDSRPASAGTSSGSPSATSNGSAGGEGKSDTSRSEGPAKTDTAPAKSGSASSGSSGGGSSGGGSSSGSKGA